VKTSTLQIELIVKYYNHFNSVSSKKTVNNWIGVEHKENSSIGMYYVQYSLYSSQFVQLTMSQSMHILFPNGDANNRT